MTAWLRLGALVLLAALALLGVALGAESQREVFLEPDLTAAQQEAQGADSNLIILTAVPVAIGLSGVLILLSRQPFVVRVRDGALTAIAIYALTNLVQGAWPNYNAYPAGRTADLANTLLAANLPATPSILVPVLALVAGLLVLLLASGTRLLAPSNLPTPGTPIVLLRRHLGLLALYAPFLLVAALGTIRLILDLPGQEPGAGPYLVLLPACILAFAALLGVGLAKAWQLGVWVRNGRLAASVEDAWQWLGRAEAVLATILGALVVASSFLTPIDRPDLHLGRTLSVTLRSHTQFLALVLVPMIPIVGLHRIVRRSLAEAPSHGAALESGTHALAGVALACTAAGLALGALATFLGAGALWPWVLAALPFALLAWLSATPRDAAPADFLVCFAVWAIGNTIVATYDGNREGVLAFEVPAGVLALWRTLAALATSGLLFGLLQRLGRDRPAVTRGMATGIAASVGAVALLEMPLWAWLTPRAGTDSLAVGSLLASLDPAVRASIHVVATILASGGVILLARLVRPEWFQRQKPPLSAPLRSKVRTTS